MLDLSAPQIRNSQTYSEWIHAIQSRDKAIKRFKQVSSDFTLVPNDFMLGRLQRAAISLQDAQREVDESMANLEELAVTLGL